jgi:hypothetical protein
VGHSTASAASPAILPDEERQLFEMLRPHLRPLAGLVGAFREAVPTPQATFHFEQAAAACLRASGRALVEHVYNDLEPPTLQGCPLRLRYAGQDYRRRPKSPNAVATLFGTICLRRYLYEAVEAGEPCLCPLEVQLGIEAGLATPALAERVGLWSAEHEQEQVRQLLAQEHGVAWSVSSIRQEAQVTRVLELLEQAFAARGKHRPVLAAGRDGIHLPIRSEGYHEGSTATLSVQDRRGRRLGTVYLGQMPEEGQEALSAQLTALLTAVLAAWHGRGRPAPRLCYVTDAGHHPKEYYQRVLRRLADPWRAGRKLCWQWVLDYWHACSYVHALAEALCGAGPQALCLWRKWRRWLRDRRQGLSQVLRSATWHYHNGRRRSQARTAAFRKAYRYLRKHGAWMGYAAYRRQGLPIGSGVTEAACKTVFAERLKRSGMTWRRVGGQVVVDLRVLVLSKVWGQAHRAYLASRLRPTAVKQASHGLGRSSTREIAA